MLAKCVLPVVVFAAVVAAWVMAGCGSDHVMRPNPNPGSNYPALLNPYSVLDALQLAYQARDTNEIKVIYHDQYDGSSIDQTDPVPALVNFLKAGEVAHVSALRRSSAVQNIFLTSAPNRVRFDDAADPVGWATIMNPFVGIQVNDTTVVNVDLAHITMEFKFIPTPVPSSSKDTTWKIIRWTEIRNP